MPEIGIGLIGGGYMGKAHAVAMSSVGAENGPPYYIRTRETPSRSTKR